MRTRLLQAVLAATLVGVACSDDVTDPVRQFEAALIGGNMVPAVSSTAGATGSFNLVGGASGEDSLSYTITVTSPFGSAATQAHLHVAAPGASTNTITAWFCGPAGTAPAGTPVCGAGTATGALVTGKIAVTAATVTSMRGFGTYVDVHTTTNGTGEIRGQLRVVGQ